MPNNPVPTLASALMASLHLSPEQSPILLFLSPGTAESPLMALQHWVGDQLGQERVDTSHDLLSQLRERLTLALHDIEGGD